jgi:hypothetical protein
MWIKDQQVQIEEIEMMEDQDATIIYGQSFGPTEFDENTRSELEFFIEALLY